MNAEAEMLKFIEDRRSFMLSKGFIPLRSYIVSNNKYFAYWYRLKFIKPSIFNK